MGACINRAQLLGHLGKDPELRYMPNGDAVANFSLATSEQWTDKVSGEKKEQVEWHRCTAFGAQADVVGKYTKKGSKVLLDGSIRTRKWQDKDGADRYTTEIRVSRVTLLDGKPAGGSEAPAPSAAKPKQPVTSGFDDMDDDIPF